MSASLDSIINQQSSASADDVVLDFTEAAEGGGDFEALPEGDYVAVVEKVETGVSKAGNAKLVWRFQVAEGPFAKRVLFKHTPTVGNGAGVTRDVIKALGISAEGEQVRFNPRMALGKKVVLEVTIQVGGDYDGSNEVGKVKAHTTALS